MTPEGAYGPRCADIRLCTVRTFLLHLHGYMDGWPQSWIGGEPPKRHPPHKPAPRLSIYPLGRNDQENVQRAQRIARSREAIDRNVVFLEAIRGAAGVRVVSP